MPFDWLLHAPSWERLIGALTAPAATAVFIPIIATLVGVLVQLIAERPITRLHWLVGKDLCLTALVLAITNMLIWGKGYLNSRHSSQNEGAISLPDPTEMSFNISLVLVSFVMLVWIMFLYRTYVYQKDESVLKWKDRLIRRKILLLQQKANGSLSESDKEELLSLNKWEDQNPIYADPKIHPIRWLIINVSGAFPLGIAASFMVS